MHAGSVVGVQDVHFEEVSGCEELDEIRVCHVGQVMEGVPAGDGVSLVDLLCANSIVIRIVRDMCLKDSKFAVVSSLQYRVSVWSWILCRLQILNELIPLSYSLCYLVVNTSWVILLPL